jgi:cytochrome c553
MKYTILALILATGISQAQVRMAQPATQLQKLSRALSGKNASVDDLNSIQNLKTDQEVQSYLKLKAREYVQSENFKLNFKFKIDELFKMQVSRNLSDRNYAYDNLIQTIINDNKNWDQLLLAHEYTISVPDASHSAEQDFEGSEHKFFETLTGGQQNVYNDFSTIVKSIDLSLNGGLTSTQTSLIEKKYQFDEKDERIAGLLSTKRFFSRYTNTALNKNRRRAAFVFDVFLCDPMVPVVPAISNENELKDIDFSVGKKLTEEQIKAHTKVDPHGQQADCMACHEKLDPLGQVFSNSNFQLSPFAAPGALFYRRSGQAPVSTPVKGLRSLARSITQQEEYIKCQTQHFWNWFIGEDVPLTDSRHQELVQFFNSIDRKPVDFILYLVSQPEFKKAPLPLTENQLLARQAAGILKTCHSCHKQNESELIDYWDMSSFPFAKDLKTRESRVAEMKKQLDTKNNSSNPKMPPRSSLWRPTQQEYLILNKWLTTGAPDLNGDLQVEPEFK